MIYLVGLGAKKAQLSVKAHELLSSGIKIIVRTQMVNSYQNVAQFENVSLDFIYQKSRNFDTLNKNLAQFVINESKACDIAYCVDGDVLADISCQIIMSKNKDVQVVAAVSKAQNIMAHIKCSANTTFSAFEISSQTILQSAVIYDIDSQYIASVVKEELAKQIGEEQAVYFFDGERAQKIFVYELDRQPHYDNLAGVYVPQYDITQKKSYNFYDVVDILRALRAPNGCPWDRAQTHKTIAINAIEEAYELADAINSQDDDKILEETGDVLMQAVFHACIASDRQAFTLNDCITALCQKLIFRHSHIFGGDSASNEQIALNVWEKNKKIEKGHATTGQTMQDLPKNLPALMYAQKLQKRAAACGFDFANANDAAAKITEEYGEVLQAITSGDQSAIFEEAGDLLFAVVNYLRLIKVNVEDALQASSAKFLKRFLKMESLALSDGKNLEELNLNQLEGYYNEAKKH